MSDLDEPGQDEAALVALVQHGPLLLEEVPRHVAALHRARHRRDHEHRVLRANLLLQRNVNVSNIDTTFIPREHVTRTDAKSQNSWSETYTHGEVEHALDELLALHCTERPHDADSLLVQIRCSEQLQTEVNVSIFCGQSHGKQKVVEIGNQNGTKMYLPVP